MTQETFGRVGLLICTYAQDGFVISRQCARNIKKFLDSYAHVIDTVKYGYNLPIRTLLSFYDIDKYTRKLRSSHLHFLIVQTNP